ncbi:hypothetical protein ACFWVU_31135 [Streptomyces sp. NPDC058686]|uniref:hypothetical protein n=1 Tax=Streptomyces sp. NPDC058686 TaxID=3346599 RepID=UPI0036491A76
MDGRTDSPSNDQDDHPLTEFLPAGLLVADLSKPFTEDSHRETERALLPGQAHTTCGGRQPNDGSVDQFFTLMVGGADGADGADGPRIKPARDEVRLPAPRP